MSELNMKQKILPFINIGRFIATFANRYFLAFFSMSIIYGILKKFLNFNTSLISTFAFLISCTTVTALWSYYLIKLTPPLLYRPINKSMKSNLISSRVMALIALYLLRNALKSSTTETTHVLLSILYFIISIAIISSFATLVVLLFKKPVSRKRKYPVTRTNRKEF